MDPRVKRKLMPWYESPWHQVCFLFKTMLENHG